MTRGIGWLTVVGFGFVLLPAAIKAETPKEGTVTASGMEKVRVQPTLLRLETQIHASGETAEKAVEQLKAKRKAAIAKLKELKAEESSIRCTNTVITARVDYGSGVLVPAQPTYGPPQAAPISPYSLPSPAPQYPSSDAAPGAIPLPPPAVSPARYGAPVEPVPETAPVTSTPAATGSTSAAPPAGYTETPDPPVPAPSGVVPAAPGTPVPAPSVVGVPMTPFGPATTPPPSGDFPTPATPGAPVPTLPPGGFSAPVEPRELQDASTNIVAQWRLDTDDPDAIALAGESLRAKLADANIFDVSGPRDQPFPYRYAASQKVGFTLTFVGMLSESQRKSALQAAMAKARQRAAELAEAGSMRLGDSCSISSQNFRVPPAAPGYVSVEPSAYLIPIPDSSEIVMPSPDFPEVTVRVTLEYPLVSKQPQDH